MMNTPCTFLGPSRKRGPPKGYIDAIEARLHQTEALLGVMIGSNDERAKSLLEDLAKDPLAKEIMNRVDKSPYGVRGRVRDLDVHQETGGGSKTRGQRQSRSSSPHEENGQLPLKTEDQTLDLHAIHPSHEWQDRVATTLRNRGSEPNFSAILSDPKKLASSHQTNTSTTVDSESSTHRRQRRKTSGEGLSNDFSAYDTSSVRNERRESVSTPSTHSDGDDIMDAVGQLSLNEDEEVRYHGKASGLYLLDSKERRDSRNEGGIWRFPPARVWPPLPVDKRRALHRNGIENDEHLSKLPDSETQEHLLELYFTYVHPSLPVIHKKTFFEVFRPGQSSCESPGSPQSPNSSSSSSPFNRRRQYIPTILLLAMFAIAERYSSAHSPPPPQDGSMWAAGDGYLDSAKVILDSTYANSRPSTVQALLLLGYREIGIGAMAQAWVYIGMAVRMAQDLGMHRSADGWARVGLGGKLFSEWELQERKRIWYSCLIMDRYVSTYIGRPLAIFDRDYDTQLPSEEEAEELEIWRPHPSKPVGSVDLERERPVEFAQSVPAPGRIISCFNASATLSDLLGRIVVCIYGIRPVSSRHVESVHFESLLDKWYLELPENLRHEPGSTKFSPPLPHVLTLHMQYWCTVLLLHRPFIQNLKHNFDGSEDDEVRTITKKHYELCAAAANHITSIVSVYSDHYCLPRSAVFLCYYIFTASIMHVTTLSTYPSDPQARVGLAKCMDALKSMEIVWPSAGRALELLRGSKVNTEEPLHTQPPQLPDRPKRSADPSFDDDDALEQRDHLLNLHNSYAPARSNPYPSSNYPPIQDGYLDDLDVNQTTSSTNSLSFYSSHERWPSNNYTTAPFPGSLSTSVLPQLYSTGLEDDRASNLRYRAQQVVNEQTGGQGRYPQYWNDLTTFPQLGSAYDTVSTQQDQGPVAQPASLYLPDQYTIYNNHQT